MRDSFQTQGAQSNISIGISPAEIRILLWDIDGTLLQSAQPGGFKEYFAEALKKTYGTRGNIDDVKAAGATDTQIVFQSLKDTGLTIEKISARMNEFIRILYAEMRDYINQHENTYEILPGVKEILKATDENPKFTNALLTGNFSVGAEMKMQSVGVWDYFKDSPNAFGEISHDRKDLAIEAGKLFNKKHGFDFKPSQFIVIGDTPHDITAAKHFGAKVICVETGRGIARADLESANPNALIKDLSDTEKVLELLEGL